MCAVEGTADIEPGPLGGPLLTQAVCKLLPCYDSLTGSAGDLMACFVARVDRGQTTLLPECLEDWVDENNSVRAVDVFIEALDLRDLGFKGVDAAGNGRPP